MTPDNTKENLFIKMTTKTTRALMKQAIAKINIDLNTTIILTQKDLLNK